MKKTPTSDETLAAEASEPPLPLSVVDEIPAAERDRVVAETDRLKARSPTASSCDGQEVQVIANQAVEADSTHDAPDLSNRVTVKTLNRPFYYHRPANGHLRLIGAGAERTFEKLKGASNTYVVDDLPRGSYSIVLDDPRFEPWSQTGVVTGRQVDLHMIGNAAVSLTVVDDDTDDPIDSYRLRVRMDDSRARQKEFE